MEFARTRGPPDGLPPSAKPGWITIACRRGEDAAARRFKGTKQAAVFRRQLDLAARRGSQRRDPPARRLGGYARHPARLHGTVARCVPLLRRHARAGGRGAGAGASRVVHGDRDVQERRRRARDGRPRPGGSFHGGDGLPVPRAGAVSRQALRARAHPGNRRRRRGTRVGKRRNRSPPGRRPTPRPSSVSSCRRREVSLSRRAPCATRASPRTPLPTASIAGSIEHRVLQSATSARPGIVPGERQAPDDFRAPESRRRGGITKIEAAIALARNAVGTLSTMSVLIGPVGRKKEKHRHPEADHGKPSTFVVRNAAAATGTASSDGKREQRGGITRRGYRRCHAVAAKPPSNVPINPVTTSVPAEEQAGLSPTACRAPGRETSVPRTANAPSANVYAV